MITPIVPERKKRTPTIPSIVVPRLASIDLDDWDSSSAALSRAPICKLQQAWRPEPSKDFRPAWVRAAWTNQALVVRADLEDHDIFNPETRFNEPSFRHGDVFEIFLRPEGQEAYFEFHIAPNNQQLQLRIPSMRAFVSSSFDQLKIKDPVIQSRTQVLQEENRWLVLALIPFKVVVESDGLGTGSRWRFSFSRYDYTRGSSQPVLSSTSPHLALNFHRQHEWGWLHFEE